MTVTAPTELYLILSDQCNFACSHCINDSGPQAGKWRLSRDEMVAVANEVNLNHSIQIINFTGGEPTLNLDLISDFQSLITRNIQYKLTTNGWLGSRGGEVLEKLKIKTVVVSYDKWHAPFISTDRLIAFVKSLRDRNIEVHLNIVFENIVELQKAQPLIEAGAVLHTTRLIAGGRANNLTTNRYIDLNAFEGVCPSLEPQGRYNGTEKLVFIPGKGFTFCCGPLAFDQMTCDDTLFRNQVSSLRTTPLFTVMTNKTFREQADDFSLDLSHVKTSSRCEACTFIYAKNREAGLPSLSELASQTATVAYYPTKARLERSKELALERAFHVKYFYVLPFSKLELAARSNPSLGEITTKDITDCGPDIFIDFTIKTFYDAFGLSYTADDRMAFLEDTKRYFKETLFGKVYFKDKTPIALITTHKYSPHPATNFNTLHIGYWGYDKSMVSLDEARAIKSDWITSLFTWSRLNGSIPIDASVDYFNEPAFRLVQKFGFELHSLRLDKRK